MKTTDKKKTDLDLKSENEKLGNMLGLVSLPVQFQAAIFVAVMLEKGHSPEEIATQLVEQNIEQSNPTVFFTLFVQTFGKNHQ